MADRYYDLNTYLRNRFGCRVQKISLDAGLTCPNRDGTLSSGGCIYCNPRGSGTGAAGRGISITDQILAGMANLGRRYKAKKFIAYFQSFSNTYAPVETLRHLYDEAVAVDGVVGLAVGTRPDCISDDILSLFKTYADKTLVWIEYGLQSVHDDTLTRINRGHDFAAFQSAVTATNKQGIPVCVHVILGLPGETRADMIETAKKLADMNIDGLKIHLLYVIRGTRLEEMYQNGKYVCMSQQEFVDIVCDFLAHTPDNVVIQRLTGDPHPEELVAPDWAMRKTETLRLIRERLEQRNLRQGCLRDETKQTGPKTGLTY
jgi:radical SAM protein (TIGR01212 family)